MTFLRFLLCLLLLQGCALQGYLAGQVDVFMEMRLQSHLDLYYQQKKKLSLDIDIWLNKQKTYLPEARSFLLAVNPAKPQEIPAAIHAFNLLYQRSAHEFNQLFSGYLSQLDEQQRKHFFHKQHQDNQALKEQIGKMDLEKLKERVEFFSGSLTLEQTPLLKDFLPDWIKRSKQRLERRITLHKKLKEILSSNVLNQQELVNLAFRNYVDSSFENLAPVVSFLQRFSATLTPEQISHLERRRTKLLELLESFNKAQF